MAGGSRAAAVRNEYSGWTPTYALDAHGAACGRSAGAQVPRVQMAELTPQHFFSQYVAARRPVVITDYLDSPEHAGSLSKWTDAAYLRSKAGDTEVRVPSRTLLPGTSLLSKTLTFLPPLTLQRLVQSHMLP
jgi:hypothetical protein